jgi:REP element-mobilizing transposase RayT
MAPEPKRGYGALRKGRWSQTNGVYLLTTVTEQRIPWFQVFEFGRVVCRGLHNSPCLGDAEALCWVVMPDHVHLLLQLREVPLHRVMNRFKSTTAIRLNRTIGRAGRFWQPGYHDRALRREDDLRATARYVVANPLRAGLVRKLADYPFWDAVWL